MTLMKHLPFDRESAQPSCSMSREGEPPDDDGTDDDKLEPIAITDDVLIELIKIQSSLKFSMLKWWRREILMTKGTTAVAAVNDYVKCIY